MSTTHRLASTSRSVSLTQLTTPLSCSRCVLATRAQHIRIPPVRHNESLPQSPSHPVVIVVDRSPSHQDDKVGFPMTCSNSAPFWDAWIPGSKLGELASIFIVNSIRCYHRDGDKPPNASYKACSPLLEPDLDLILMGGGSKVFILTLGAEATTHTYAFFGHKKINLTSALSMQGTEVQWKSHRIALYSTYRPVHCLMEHRHIFAVQDHLALLTSAIRGLTPLKSKPQFVTPRSPRIKP